VLFIAKREDDADDHRQLAVRVDVSCDRDAVLAASIGEELPDSSLEEVEVHEPERGRDEESEQRCDNSRPASSGVSRVARPIATSDSPIAMITISPVPLGEVRGLHPPASARPKKPTASAAIQSPVRRPSSVNRRRG
jgi:hypothetical protein